MNTKKFSRLTLLTALSLILFTAEMALPAPIPVPGAKLGLANVITVWALYHCTARETLLVLLARILLGALFSGNAGALIFSLSGGLLCLAGTLPLRHVISERRLWLCSAAGGMLHNAGQLAAAVIMTNTTELLSYLPFLMLSGIVCGMLTGQIAQQISARLRYY